MGPAAPGEWWFSLRSFHVFPVLSYALLQNRRVPGGVVNADALRTDAHAQAFVQAIDAAGKPLAVICHGAWLLIDAGLVGGKTLTSWPSLQVDLRNAGATWVDEQVHADGAWISSRKPDDIPVFNAAILKALGASS